MRHGAGIGVDAKRKLPDKIRWHMLNFGEPQQYQVALGTAPQSVETVINHRVLNQSTTIVGVSGGVLSIRLVCQSAAIQTDTYGMLKAERTDAAPKKLQHAMPGGGINLPLEFTHCRAACQQAMQGPSVSENRKNGEKRSINGR